MLNSFSQWMEANTELSKSSIEKYTRAVKVTSKEMLEHNVISKSLFNMNQFELDIAIELIFASPDFIDENTRGNNMYSSSLKQFRCFRYIQSDFGLPDNIIDTTKSLISEKFALTKIRVGQGSYRKNLIKKYHGQCIVTGISQENLLIASHIKPWAVCAINERTDVENGLLLSANIDRLFDSGLITFDNKGKMLVSSYISNNNAKLLCIDREITVDLKPSNTLIDYLKYHRSYVYVK